MITSALVKFETDTPYEVLSEKVWMQWSYGYFQNQYVNVAETLRSAMTFNDLSRSLLPTAITILAHLTSPPNTPLIILVSINRYKKHQHVVLQGGSHDVCSPAFAERDEKRHCEIHQGCAVKTGVI